MKTKITGRVWKYGDDVNTDVIFPGKYTYSISDPKEMAQHALEDLDPSFVENVRPGDIIVAGKNWGCGSSREQAVTCLKEAGVGAIVARSFARIYFRNCINQALPIVTCDAVDGVEKGQEITIDFAAGTVTISTSETQAAPASGTQAAPASGTQAAPASGTQAAPASGTQTAPDGVYNFPPLPPEVMEILEAGGLIPYVRQQVE